MCFFSKIFPKIFFQLVGGVRSEQSLQKARVFSRKLAQCSGGMGAHYARKTLEHNARILGAQSRRATPEGPNNQMFPKLSVMALHQEVDIAVLWRKQWHYQVVIVILYVYTPFLKKNCAQFDQYWLVGLKPAAHHFGGFSRWTKMAENRLAKTFGLELKALTERLKSCCKL